MTKHTRPIDAQETAVTMESGSPTETAMQNVLGNLGEMVETDVRNYNGGTLDPAPSEHEVAMKRLSELMGQVSDAAVAELRRLRDDIDATIRQINAKHEDLTNDFRHHVNCVVESLKFREIASDHLNNVRARFAIPTQGAKTIAGETRT
jgi:uncharacterized protein YPO0396